MTLLVAQLRHQDPNSPLQPHELAAQLAQFTSVEQLTQLNEAMDAQTQAAQMAALSAQSSLSASLIGREIEAIGNQVVVPSSGHAHVLVDIGGTGGKAKLTLSDASGKTIATRELGSYRPGSGQTIQLPTDLPPGAWRYTVEVTGANDAKSPVTTYSSGVVSAVEFRNGEIILQAGGLLIPLSDLVRIAPAAAATPGDTTPTAPVPDRREGGPLGLPGLPDGFTIGGERFPY